MRLLEEILGVYETECDECGGKVPLDRHWVDHLDKDATNGWFMQVEGGLCLNMGGHYGGFNDMMFEDPSMILCHDCCVKLYKTFPNAVKRLVGDSYGLHPYEGETPCCEFGWTSIKDENGKWVDTIDMTYDKESNGEDEISPDTAHGTVST